MRVVIQRVTQASVQVDGETIGRIDTGLLIYLSITHTDTQKDAEFIAEKIANLRIFADSDGKMNLSVQDINAGILLISQFTLHGDCRKGRRPSFSDSAEPNHARKLYEHTIKLVRNTGITVATGVFAANMDVTSTNDGPVTFLLDSTRLF